MLFVSLSVAWRAWVRLRCVAVENLSWRDSSHNIFVVVFPWLGREKAMMPGMKKSQGEVPDPLPVASSNAGSSHHPPSRTSVL